MDDIGESIGDDKKSSDFALYLLISLYYSLI